MQGNVDPSHLLTQSSCMLSTSCITAKTASTSIHVCCLLNTVRAGPASQLHQLVRCVHHTAQGVPCHRVGDRGRAFGQVCACIAALKLKSQCCRVHVCAGLSPCCPAIMLHHVTNPFWAFNAEFCMLWPLGIVWHVFAPLAGVMFPVQLMQHCGFCSLQPIKRSLSVCRLRCHQCINTSTHSVSDVNIYTQLTELHCACHLQGGLLCRVTEKGNYSEKDASDLIRQVLEGVAYLHSQGTLGPHSCTNRSLHPYCCTQ